MRTLKQLQDQMRNGTDKQKLAAAMEVTNFNLTYNEEYNMLLNLEAEVKVAHYEVTHTKNGINHGYRLDLEALSTQIAARKAFLDMQMMSFHNSEIGINAPDQKVIDEVKKLTDGVGKQVLKENAIQGILTSLSEISSLVNGTMSRSA